MHYTIHNITHKSHALDEHYVNFYFDVQFTEPEKLEVKRTFYDYSSLSSYLREKHPDFAAYLASTRNSIEHWGPCEHLVLEAIGDEAVQQLYRYLEEYLLQADWMPKLFEQQKQWQNSPVQEQAKTQQAAEKVFKDLDSHRLPMQLSQKRYYRFCETVEKQIRQTAMDVYPQLADGNAEQMKEFRYLFVSHIQAMYTTLEKFTMKLKKSE